MPRGERQTTGTAQALLGAKQIAAQERASKRATVADYVKTGVGALKSVGDYLQQKQSLEQNQDKINLEKSLFSAQFGDEGEQEARRQSEQALRVAQTRFATSGAVVAERTEADRIKAEAEAAKKLGGEAAQAVAAGGVAPEVEAQKLAEGKLRIEGMTIANKVADIRSGFAEGFAQGELDLVRAKKDALLQDIESSRAGITDAEEGRKLDRLRLEIEKNYREALMADMKEKGLLSKRQMKIFEKRYKDETDPARRVAMMTEFEKRVAESTAKKAELDVKFAEGTLENRISMSVLDLKGKKHEVGSAGEKKEILKIQRQFAKLREKGEVDRLVKVTESLDQQIKASISGEKRADRRLVLEGRRLVVEEERGQALIQKMKEEGLLAGKQFDLLKEKWEKTSDPEKREAMLSDFDKRLREAQLEESKQRTKSLAQASASEAAREKLYTAAGGKAGYEAKVLARIAKAGGAEAIGKSAPAFNDMGRQASADIEAGKKDTPAIWAIDAINRMAGQAEGASGLGIAVEEHNVDILADGMKDDGFFSSIHGRRAVEYFAKLHRDAPNEFGIIVKTLARKWPGSSGKDDDLTMWSAFYKLREKQAGLIARGGAVAGQVGEKLKLLAGPPGWAAAVASEVQGTTPADKAKAGMTVIKSVMDILNNPNTPPTLLGPDGLSLLNLTTVGGD